MAVLLLDTDVVVDFLNGRDVVAGFLRARRVANDRLALTPPVVAEVWTGVPPGRRDDVGSILDSFERLPLTESAARRAGVYRYESMRAGRPLALVDLLIAAVAAEHGAILVTRNRRHFPMTDFTVLSPT